MAQSYQVSCPPGSATVLADNTLGGGRRVSVKNGHASQGLIIGGDQNQLTTGGGGSLTTTTGYFIAAGGEYTTIIDGNEAIYGRGNTSTVTVTVYVFRTNAI